MNLVDSAKVTFAKFLKKLPRSNTILKMTTLSLGIFCSFYKGSKFLKGYLNNIVEQTLFSSTNFYLLSCASPEKEDEEELILPYTKAYSNIQYRRLNKDPGLYAGWNECIKSMEEPYIGNWNVDDRRNPWSLEILLDKISSDVTLDLVYGQTLVTQVANDTWDKTKSNMLYPCLPHSFENLLRNNSPHCMPIWRRSLHERYGYFDNNLKTAADTDMWLRASKDGAKMALVNEVVGLYYENPNGRSTNPETLQEMIEEVIAVRKKHEKN